MMRNFEQPISPEDTSEREEKRIPYDYRAFLGEANFIRKNEMGKRIDTEEFKEIYGDEEVQEDQKRVEMQEAYFQEKLNQLPPEDQERQKAVEAAAEALEVVTSNHIELSNWFGDDAMVVRTSRYDDVINKVDSVIEFLPPEEEEQEEIDRLALAIDVTMSRASLEKKMGKNMQRVRGDLPSTELKYFKSQVETNEQGEPWKGRLSGVIPVVIGLEGNRLRQLFRVVERADDKKDPRTRAAALKELENHPVQLAFLEQVHCQLQSYADYLASEEGQQHRGKFPPYEAEKVERALTLVKAIEKEKKTQLDEWANQALDRYAVAERKEEIGFYGKDHVLENIREIAKVSGHSQHSLAKEKSNG